MWIIHQGIAESDGDVATASLRHDDYTDGDAVAFSLETGKAQVTRDVGEQLCNHYDTIVPADDAGDDTNRSES